MSAHDHHCRVEPDAADAARAIEAVMAWWFNSGGKAASAAERLAELTGRAWTEDDVRESWSEWLAAKAERREAEEATQPSGLTTKLWGSEEYRRQAVTIVVRLPHVIMAAAVAEEAGKASGSTRLHGLGIPIPYTDSWGRTGVVRLWALWEKQLGGVAKLRGFDVRKGKNRSGELLLRMMLRAHDGALVGHAGTGERSDISYLEELSRRLLELEAASQSDDPLATLARSVVAQARCTFCCCCGRALTDPVSVETGIGPECGATFHAVFRSRWRAEQRELQ